MRDGKDGTCGCMRSSLFAVCRSGKAKSTVRISRIAWPAVLLQARQGTMTEFSIFLTRFGKSDALLSCFLCNFLTTSQIGLSSRVLDENNHAIGMANISAGMKQFAAQALLWALKDVAGTPCPVVIDTPLARIDAGHQKLLITKFFPAVAEQVIVLPTDSELDAAKYAMLKPFICAEFCLKNPRGDSTIVTHGVPMHTSEVAE